MTAIPFTKMHGLGNAYVHVDGFSHRVDDPGSLARAVSSVATGVGGDGLILMLPPTSGDAADLRMRIFNADGSEAEMCGNGIRCVCKYAHDHGLSRSSPMRIETASGVRTLDYAVGPDGRVAEVTVAMGPPRFGAAAVDADPARLEPAGVASRLEVGGETIEAVLVSMGNPHAVVYVDALRPGDVEALGPLVARHPAFPRGINAHLVRVDDAGEVTVAHWERGSGATRACGTGAAAVCAAGVAGGRTGRAITAHLPGGDLCLEWDGGDGEVRMTGPAVEIFRGVWTPDGVMAGETSGER